MKQKQLKKLFRYFFKKKIFSFTITTCVVLGIVSWIHLRSAVQKNVDIRLDNELQRVSSSITNNLNSYAGALSSVYAYYKTEGLPDRNKFRRLAENLQIQRINHGIQGVGYISIVKQSDLKKFIAQHHRVPFFQTQNLMPGSKFYAPITMLEPLNWRQSPTLGADLLTNSVLKTAIFETINTAGMTMAPLQITMEKNKLNFQYPLLLMLPYYGKIPTPATLRERQNTIKGLIFIPIRLEEFFNSTLGVPNINNEQVNFRLESVDLKTNEELIAYNRFDLPQDKNALHKSKMIDLYGSKWKITITTFPNFLSLSDRYITTAAAFVFFLFIGLLISIFNQVRNLIVHEKKAKALMDDSNKVKAAFLSNMSHEIRTPLNAITGYSEILNHTTSIDEKNSLIEGIRKNTTQLASLIDNILDISKIEFGKIYLNKKDICFISIIEEIKWVMDTRVQAKGIQFYIESIGELPMTIQTDEARIKQILINLVGNAIKFTEKGSVKLQIQTEISPDNEVHLLFTVIDTGIGISFEDQTELFKSFSQVDISSTRRFGGVGLGLVVSRRLAQQFGGDVFLLDSRLNQGSVFQLKIPCGDIKNAEWKNNLFTEKVNSLVHLEVLEKSHLQGKKVLIVEDSEDNQNIFSYFLNNAGATTEVVANGFDAVQKTLENEYDLILMDIQLPLMDGLEATRRIRLKQYTKPIIALTAHSSSEEKMNCLKAGCIGLITKPVTQETLLQQILHITEDIKNDRNTNS